MAAVSTTELVGRASAGDQTAWNTIVERYTRLVWHVVQGFPSLDPALRADAHQTAWLRLAERLDTIREPEALGNWLATTARNECLRILRRQTREQPAETLDERTLDEPLDRHLLDSERDAELWAAFRRLDDGCQALLRLLLADPPFSYDEIATLLDMKRGSIGPTRGRCLDKLRSALADSTEGDRS